MTFATLTRKEEYMNMLWRTIGTVAAAILLLAGMPAARQVLAAHPQQAARATVMAHLNSPFTATVVQGPAKGQVYSGKLQVAIMSSGAIAGKLVTAQGQSVAVTGQITGQLIGLYFNIGKGKNIFGTGLVGYDTFQHAPVMGGTFTGPDDLSTGVWEVVIVGFTYQTGGCIRGIDAGNGSCIIIR
jgi:hypothetical protein